MSKTGTKHYSFFATANFGVAELLQKEVLEFGFSDVTSCENIVFFSGSLELALAFLQRSHLVLSFQLCVGKSRDFETLNVSTKDFGACVSLLEIVQHGGDAPLQLSVKAEEISGNETRIEIGGKVSSNVREQIRSELKIESKVDYKNPLYRFIVVKFGDGYLLGLRMHVEELDSREYRVFHHKAGYKGDFTAAFLYKLFEHTVALGDSNKVGTVSSGLLVCQGRDGMFAIESAIMQSKGTVRDLERTCLERIPCVAVVLQSLVAKEKNEKGLSEPGENKEFKESEKSSQKLVTFATSSSPNLRSTISNAKVAGVDSLIYCKKSALDEYAFDFGSDVFSHAIVRLTRKDERDLNELFYQLSEVLVPGGYALLIYRENLDLPISERFELLEKSFLSRGHGKHPFALLKLKN